VGGRPGYESGDYERGDYEERLKGNGREVFKGV
jgi:hypothetical protein